VISPGVDRKSCAPRILPSPFANALLLRRFEAPPAEKRANRVCPCPEGGSVNPQPARSKCECKSNTIKRLLQIAWTFARLRQLHRRSEARGIHSFTLRTPVESVHCSDHLWRPFPVYRSRIFCGDARFLGTSQPGRSLRVDFTA